MTWSTEHSSSRTLNTNPHPIRSVRWVFELRNMITQRSNRVMFLSIAIIVMSLADLYLTLLFVTKTGMNEINPLARAMMEYQSPAILAFWKLGTITISIGILMFIRKQRSAEFGAWIGCIVLGLLMAHWMNYIEQTSHMQLELAQSDDPTWIMMPAQAEGAEGIGAWIID